MTTSMSERAARVPKPTPAPGFERVHRYWDHHIGHWSAKILPGEYYVTSPTRRSPRCSARASRPASATKELAIGGMNHFMLPEDTSDGRSSWLDKATGLSTRYGSFAMESLINEPAEARRQSRAPRSETVRRRPHARVDDRRRRAQHRVRAPLARDGRPEDLGRGRGQHRAAPRDLHPGDRQGDGQAPAFDGEPRDRDARAGLPHQLSQEGGERHQRHRAVHEANAPWNRHTQDPGAHRRRLGARPPDPHGAALARSRRSRSSAPPATRTSRARRSSR